METRFYCDNCGSDVPFNAEVCPSCGKVFSAVKCPVCLYEGRAGEFLQGCPKCGYMSPKMEHLKMEHLKMEHLGMPHPKSRSESKIKVRAGSNQREGKGQTKKTPPLLPRWVYRGAILLLFVILLALIVLLLHT